jgi:hypothetical protein
MFGFHERHPPGQKLWPWSLRLRHEREDAFASNMTSRAQPTFEPVSVMK